ncbi:MAG: hypothetical protein RIR14_92, partial [Pseudomonadota bacterium]
MDRTRRKFSREFKIQSVRLVTYEADQELIRGINSPTNRGVAVAEAAHDLDIAESVLRGCMREPTAISVTAFPGNGQMRADLVEISALIKEVARPPAERGILKIGEPCAPSVRAQWRTLFPREGRYEVRLHCKASSHLAR